ncbi:hypothetical protein DRN62_01110 [Nanoarchaeota archaeon]|nr:MAG: hypothetical protein DRN62_01110 [Nanoarchaeota archaeon]
MLMRKLYYLSRVLRQQWYSKRKLEKLQNKALRAIVEHAYRTVPFYRRVFSKLKLRPSDVRRKEDLKKLPVINKETVLKYYKDFMSRAFGNTKEIYQRTSSGSSGTPLKVPFDSRAIDYMEAVYARDHFAVGYRPWWELAYYWYEPFKPKLYEKFGLMRKRYIPCNLSLEQQLKILEEAKPKAIYYYATSMYYLAKKAEELGVEINPKLIITHAEILTEKMRRTIEDVFKAPVYDQYGSTEFIRMAWECKERMGYHIDADAVIMEFLKDGEPVEEERGSVVITGLVNYFFPLIRYDQGDIAVPSNEKCACGRKFPMIKKIEGRREYFLGRVSPRELLEVLFKQDSVKMFYVEKKEGKLNFKVVPGEGFKEKKLRKVLKSLFKKRISIEIVSDVKKSPRGKYRVYDF